MKDIHSRVYNFGAGPAYLPEPVLRRIEADLFNLEGSGSSILEISHRSDLFDAILQRSRARLKKLLDVPSSHEILLLQGGSRLQFSAIPLNLSTGTSGYFVTGTWSKLAFEEAQRLGAARQVWTGESANFRDVPDVGALAAVDGVDYVYFTSNETIHGVQFRQLPGPGPAPLVCDMSSDFLSRPVSVSDFRLLFACAQKNAGIAGVTVVIVERDGLGDRTDLPAYLDYRTHLAADNLYNTPPTFAIYVLDLMLDWLESEFGSLAGVQRANTAKARQIYAVLDNYPDLYVGHAALSARSIANVTFNLGGGSADQRSARLEAFLQGAKDRGLTDLRGHRSVGGVRVSLYNAMPPAAVDRLVEYMEQFAQQSGATLRVARPHSLLP